MELGLGTSITLRRNLAEFIETLQVSIFSPNSSPLQAGTVEFSGSATGPNPITTLEYQIDDGAFTSFTVAENWTVDITLGVSNTSVTIRATDDTLATATDTFNFTVVASDTQLPITTSLESDYDILGTSVITEDNTLSVKTAQSWQEESADQHTIANLTKAEQPVYDDVNDEVEFDGQDDILSGTFTQFSTANTTIFAYLKSPETTDVKSLFSVYQNGNADTAFSHGVEFGLVDGKATCWYGDGTNNQMIQESVATDHTSYQVWEFVNDGGTRRFLIDGTEIGNSTTAYSISVDRLQIGGRGTANFADCDIKTVFFYSDNKSSGDRTTLRNHINSRFAPADVTAPVLTNATGTSTGDTTADGSVDTDEANGTLYWVVTQNTTTPSAAQIKAGNDHTGAVADDSGNQVVNATGTQNVSSTGLTVSTTYYFHFMHEDSSTNQSTPVSSSSFITGASANTFFRSFNNDTLGQLPAEFVELFGSSSGWTVVEFPTAGPDQYLNQSAGGTGRDAVGWKQGTDVEIVTKYYRDGSSVIGGPAGRMASGGTETGYTVWNRPDANSKIVRHESGSESIIVANELPTGHRWIIVRFRINSDDIQMRIHPVETIVGSARSANDDFVLGPIHEFRDNMEVTLTADVMPGGLATETSYFVRRIDENQFALQTSSPVDGGASDIDITSDGSNITFTLLSDETARSDWNYTVVDANITGSGYAGLFDIFGNCYFKWIGIGLEGETAPSS